MKRLPLSTPGVAISETQESMDVVGDFTLPMELNRDAVVFYAIALRYAGSDRINASRSVRRYANAAIVAAFASLEAQLNLAAAGHARAHADVLEPVVLDVLHERETTVDERGFVLQRKRSLSLTTTLSFLTAFLCGQEFPRDGQLWQKLRRAIELRDRCVHPKPPFPHQDDLTAADAEFAITSVTAVLSKISEMIGDEPQGWWGPADRLLDSLDDGDIPIIDVPPRT
jgi:hypothetical protein